MNVWDRKISRRLMSTTNCLPFEASAAPNNAPPPSEIIAWVATAPSRLPENFPTMARVATTGCSPG
jgi:hypothetical protein